MNGIIYICYTHRFVCAQYRDISPQHLWSYVNSTNLYLLRSYEHYIHRTEIYMLHTFGHYLHSTEIYMQRTYGYYLHSTEIYLLRTYGHYLHSTEIYILSTEIYIHRISTTQLALSVFRNIV